MCIQVRMELAGSYPRNIGVRRVGDAGISRGANLQLELCQANANSSVRCLLVVQPFFAGGRYPSLCEGVEAMQTTGWPSYLHLSRQNGIHLK